MGVWNAFYFVVDRILLQLYKQAGFQYTPGGDLLVRESHSHAFN